GVGQRKDHGDILSLLALPVDAAPQLLELGSGPGQDINDQAIADPLQAIDPGADGTGADQNIDITLQETVEARLVLAGVEADFPAIRHQRIPQQPVDTLNVMGVDERLAFDV